MAKAKAGQNGPTVIKKYANRRLYDTGRSSYVTLDDLCEMIQEGHDFVVYDAKSGDDITRAVLTQIIVEQESKEDAQNLLPIGFLRQLISFYGDNIQGLVPNYLEQTLDLFTKNQEQMREHINKSFEGMRGMENMFPMQGGNGSLEELSRQNMAMFERTMQMFSPFGTMGDAANQGGMSAAQEEKINDLKKNIAAMEAELNNLSK